MLSSFIAQSPPLGPGLSVSLSPLQVSPFFRFVFLSYCHFVDISQIKASLKCVNLFVSEYKSVSVPLMFHHKISVSKSNFISFHYQLSHQPISFFFPQGSFIHSQTQSKLILFSCRFVYNPTLLILTFYLHQHFLPLRSIISQ